MSKKTTKSAEATKMCRELSDEYGDVIVIEMTFPYAVSQWDPRAIK